MSVDPSINHVATYTNSDIYNVKFSHHSIQSTLTSSSRCVVSWIRRIESIHRHHRHNLVVGLNVDWRPHFSKSVDFGRKSHNPVAALQLCVGHICLVLQIRYAKAIPKQLVDFLANANYTFVGVGIDEVAHKLLHCFGFHVRNTMDLRTLASSRLDQPKHENSGLAALAKAVLGIEYWKPKEISSSNWGQPFLIKGQKVLLYATIEAFLCFETGKCLSPARFC